ncbi:glycoside hydrolase family 3 C-terminal domain-containing protein [Asticcacaulis solisilvae]|uniref:glycoside hydrolase family 3 C-terminal domain-containing protein n=1 Tax=Asticcacaulis solisilvae TaxID=1217274 RepID=UPI003FD7A96F
MNQLKFARHHALVCVSMVALSFAAAAHAADPAYLDTRLSPEARAKDIVSRLTLDEKAAQMQDNAPAIPRLGISRYGWWNEVLHGVARAGHATVFPQAIGLAATWDTKLMDDVGSVIAVEGRANRDLALARDASGTDRYFGVNYWSPNINIFRDPRWGRGQETYGEDPYLTGHMAISFIHGIQGDDDSYWKGVATPKHFVVHSGPEPLRHGFNVDPSPFDLEDTYLPAFRSAIVDGHARSLMCAYNAVNGAPACANPLLETRIRHDWGFKGFIVTDCDSIDDMVTGHKSAPDRAHASAAGVKAGADLDCGSSYAALPDAVKAGLIPEADLDRSLIRLIAARIRMQTLDNRSDTTPASEINSPEHRALALKAAREAVVLLKNDKGLLPLAGVRRIAVIGPNAANLQSIEGNYTGVPVDPILPADALRTAFGDANVVYAPGAPLTEGMRMPIPETYLHPAADSADSGLKGEYYANLDFSGAPAVTRTDRRINFDFYHTAPDMPGFKPLGFSIRWSGVITPPAPGTYQIGFRMTTPMPRKGAPLPDVKVWIDDKLVLDPEIAGVTATPVPCASDSCPAPGHLVDVTFADTKPHTVRIDYVRKHDDRITAFEWIAPSQPLIDGAVKAAQGSDAVVAFVGLSPDLEGEEMKVNYPGFSGGDRTTLNLPQAQVDMLKAVKATGKPLVVVYLTGGPITDPWVEQNADALVQGWYPGEAGGTAIADVLTGKYNPSGRLPYTIYADLSELPAFEDYSVANRTYRYFKGKVLHPFGYGLSYTRFTYGAPRLKASVRAGAGVPVSVAVTNTGKTDGDEVVQVYVTKPKGYRTASHVLAGFNRIALKAGETKTVTLMLTPRDLSQPDDKGVRKVLPGKYTVYAGGGQPGLSEGHSATLTVTGTTTLPR